MNQPYYQAGKDLGRLGASEREAQAFLDCPWNVFDRAATIAFWEGYMAGRTE